MRHMKLSREHESANVLLRFEAGAYWEEWSLRTNRGSKANNPVKFFAERLWRSDNTRALVPFAATRGDFASEKDAQAHFLEQVSACGGEMLPNSARLSKELELRFGRSTA